MRMRADELITLTRAEYEALRKQAQTQGESFNAEEMQAIRERVASKGPAFDTLDGLGLKCFLIRERGRFGAQGNAYAPVYLWPRIDAMWGFLAGAGFAGIKASFGTPPVELLSGVPLYGEEGEFTQALDYLHLGADSEALWAAAGPSSEPPRPSTPFTV